MKIFFLSIICLTRLCFGFTQITHENLKKSWDFASNCDYKNAIAYMSLVIEDPTTTNVEKVHYYIARSQFFSMNMDGYSQSRDMIILGNLIREYPECMEEKIKYYQCLDYY